MNWEQRTVLVTGGASFIGSHLCEALLARGVRVRVVDDLTSGKIENLRRHVEDGRIDFTEGDLRHPDVARTAVAGVDVVFHLAAAHGGRGFIDTHDVECSTNLILDGQVLRQAADAGVDRLVFASSGCVYPTGIQNDPSEELYLSEDMVGPPYESDNLYGWAKLMGEKTLRAYCREGKLQGAAVRYFTVYGPRCPENQGIMAMIARAYAKQDPFTVWGTGEQIRNWTFVDDIVSGSIAAAEHITDGRAVNLGTDARTSVAEAARMILSLTGHDAQLRFDPAKPTGPYNRTCDNSLAKELMGWEPKVHLEEGVRRAIDWYDAFRDGADIRDELPRLLTER